MTERDVLEVAAWLAVVGVIASVSAGLLAHGEPSRRMQGWIRLAAIVAGVAYVLVGVVALAVIL